MNPRYTFDSFVVGQNNHYAAAASKAVDRRARQDVQPALSSTAASGWVRPT